MRDEESGRSSQDDDERLPRLLRRGGGGGASFRLRTPRSGCAARQRGCAGGRRARRPRGVDALICHEHPRPVSAARLACSGYRSVEYGEIRDRRLLRLRGGRSARRWCRRSRRSSTARRRSRASCALCGTRSIGVSTDGLSRLSVGGATLSRIASSEKIASTAPGRAEQMADRRLGRGHRRGRRRRCR